MTQTARIAAIQFLNPAPLMWDFNHPSPITNPASPFASRYQLDWMLPSACADALVSGAADLGLVPIAALARNPELQPIPGSTIASKRRVRSLILVHRQSLPLEHIRSIAADTASRATLAYTQTLFRLRHIDAQFIPTSAHPKANLAQMLSTADAALIIGDAALLALEEQEKDQTIIGQPLHYHDLAELWRATTGLAWVSAIWAAAPSFHITPQFLSDLDQSRIHGLQNIESLVAEWAAKLPIPASTIRTYLTENIHYTLDDECLAGLRGFFNLAAQTNILPPYQLNFPVVL